MSDGTLAKLLFNLKMAVSSILEREAANLWRTPCDGDDTHLNRLCIALSNILHHESKLTCSSTTGHADVWPFIEGLNWLEPLHGGCVSPIENDPLHPPFSDKTLKWIHQHVVNSSIADKLGWLLSDEKHLRRCYYDDAFMCNPQYAEAMLVCLRALEENQLAFLSNIDRNLLVGSQSCDKVHRRCSSFPQTSRRKVSQAIEMPVFSGGAHSRDHSDIVVSGIGIIHGSIPKLHQQEIKERPRRRTKSLPCILTAEPMTIPLRLRSNTIVSRVSPSVLKVEYTETVKKSRRRRERQPANREEENWTNVRPISTGYFPRPTQGQSLTSFLSSGPFTSAELDRENAHFRISEAMISAIEQVKCNRTLNLVSPGSSVGQPSGSAKTTAAAARIRKRRSRATTIPTRRDWGDRDTPTTSEVTASSSDLDSSEEEEGGSDAEQVALSLLKQFEDEHLPRASDLEWLVAAHDTPQQLLPMPGGWPVCAVEGSSTRLRGTIDWAPPRPQLIFTLHPTPVRKVLLAKQRMRCAGCGSKVAVAYANRFRYCEYLGKYFCTGCHTNQPSIIPAKVIHNWDFNKYSVSTFSYRLLEQMTNDPLFRIDDLNPNLYKKVKPLERTRTYRLQLNFLKGFLLSCRFADHLKELIGNQPDYSLSEPDKFSLKDLIRVKSGELPVYLQAVVKTGLAHVDTCDLCQARGFLCELCACKATIFPWAVGEVSRCPHCGACFHKKCFKSLSCPRCVRLAARNNKKIS